MHTGYFRAVAPVVGLPYTYIRDPLPSTETEAMRSHPYYFNFWHVTLRSCDQATLPSIKSLWLVSILFLRDIFINTN